MPNIEEAEFLPLRVSTIDNLIATGGVERGSTIMISGGCGSGKTIFLMQSLYNSALKGEKVAYFSMEESPEKIKRHMKLNFGWDIAALEKKGLMCVLRADPFALARDVELTLEDGSLKKKASLESILEKYPEISLIDSKRIELPFHPDRIVIDSMSALSNAFTDMNKYRIYLQVLIESLNTHNSLNMIIVETEQEPVKYSSIGPEEFLVDGVIALYNIRKGQLRRRALEILKMRCSSHVRELVTYQIDKTGIRLMPDSKVY